MSIKIMTWVWDHSHAEGNHRLVLLALADNANDEGRCWPSLKTIAGKTRVSIDTVRRAVRALADMGELAIEEKGSGHRSNSYRILWTNPNPHPPVRPRSPHRYQPAPAQDTPDTPTPDTADATHTTTPTSLPDSPGGVADCDPSQIATPGTVLPQTSQPAPLRGGTAVLPEPSLAVIEPSGAASTPSTRAHRIPDDFTITDPMRAWASENAPWVANLDRETANFVDYWQAKSGQGATKRDWLATWRKWMRTASDRVKPWERQEITNARQAVASRTTPEEYPGDPDDLEAFIAWTRTQKRGGAR